MFQLTNQPTKINSFTPRMEKHGDENVLAGTMKCETTMHSSVLDIFDKGFRKLLYRKPSPGEQTELPLGDASDGLLAEIGRMGGRHPVVSSNMQLRQDGIPYAQQRAIDDKGIAVYFERKGKPMCFACDRYTSLEANMRAIELTIAALRGITRWGASDMLERAFTGFTALPGAGASEHWSDVLGVPETASRADIDAAYRRLRSQHHPDRGGDAEQFHRITKAYEEATS